jgi:hypothetical protein
MTQWVSITFALGFFLTAVVSLAAATAVNDDKLPSDGDTLTYLGRGLPPCVHFFDALPYCEDHARVLGDAHAALSGYVHPDPQPDADLVHEIFGARLDPADVARQSAVARLAVRLTGNACARYVGRLAPLDDNTRHVNAMIQFAANSTDVGLFPVFDPALGVMGSLLAAPPAREIPTWIMHPALRENGNAMFFGALASLLRDRAAAERLEATYGSATALDRAAFRRGTDLAHGGACAVLKAARA